MICVGQILPRKIVLGDADYAAITLRHELDRTDRGSIYLA